MPRLQLGLAASAAWRRARGEAVRDDTDEALMLRYRHGEVRAFEVLLTRHRRPIYNFILRFVLDRAQAEDLLQETFLRVIKGSESYERQAKFTTWLYTIARNLCVDASRRAKHRRADSLDAPLDAEDGSATLLDRVADQKGTVDRQVIGKQLGERIQCAVDKLVEEQREVFVLREVMDLPFKEIAVIVGCPENTVKSRMRYALEKLREALEEYRDLAQAAQ
ncbi:MAG: RNA polymerase sigma factor [Myxococcales bacterium]|nr:RNA polymerase sigma factor [Myxococcales bacterium]